MAAGQIATTAISIGKGHFFIARSIRSGYINRK
jgi:hypothetical protein